MSDDDEVLRGGNLKPPAARAAEGAARQTGGDVKEKVVSATNGLTVTVTCLSVVTFSCYCEVRLLVLEVLEMRAV